MSKEQDETKRGFLINNDINKNVENISFHTLKLALKSYFSTYHSMRNNFNLIKKEEQLEENEQFVETIIHFHHFFELYLKSIIRNIDELLVLDFVKDSYILYKLIKKEEVTPNEYEKIKTVGFSRTLEIFEKLLGNDIVDPKYKFIKEEIESIKKLNTLRNRIIHRGLYILQYKDLDIFIVKRILPIIREILVLENDSNNYKICIGKNLDVDLDIIEELCKEGKEPDIDYSSIALLKELGRSSYNNPLYLKGEGFGSINENFNNIMINRFENIAKIETNIEEVDHVEKCPCCGLETLVCYIDEGYSYDKYEGNYYISDVFNIFREATCTCCNFSINQFIKKESLK